VSGDPKDIGRFRAPILRNIEVTAPYMHDGSMMSLQDIIQFYKAGTDLINFLRSLTDHRFLTDERFANPWKKR
jgi:cytochrome c peroxidase